MAPSRFAATMRMSRRQPGRRGLSRRDTVRERDEPATGPFDDDYIAMGTGPRECAVELGQLD